MSAQLSLIGELQDAIDSGTPDKRIDTLRRITDLFLVAPSRLNDEQIGVFDHVLTHLVQRVETKARAELAKRLASVEQAPDDVIQRLARDEEIAVAGPVLTQSTKLSTADLVEIAKERGQAHLLAIAGREHLEETVTDVLVNRGDRGVAQALAGNSGAAFSRAGYSKLVDRAENDDTLAEMLGKRSDIPHQLFRELLVRATETARTRLAASAGADKQDLVREVLAEVSVEVGRSAPLARDVEKAQRLVQSMRTAGRLNEAELMRFVQKEKYSEVVAGLALMGGVGFDLIDGLMRGDRNAMLVPCKVAGLTWPAVCAIAGLNGKNLAAQDFDQAAAEYARLSTPTAARVLRFWQVRHATQAQAQADAQAQASA